MSGTTAGSDAGSVGSDAGSDATTVVPGHLAPSPLALPRARALTDALLCPPPPSFDVDDAPLLADRLARLIAQTTDHTADQTTDHTADQTTDQATDQARHAPAREPGRRPDPVGCVRIGAYQLLPAGRAPQAGTTPVPFHWTARRARRAIGLAALRQFLDGDAAAPAEAVAAVVADPVGHGGLGARGPGSCADWIVSLPPAGRAAVRAAATTWATQLWCALEWARIEPAPVVGPPDRWWTCGSRVRVALRGRADVRLEGAGGVHLSVLAGQPTPESRMALCLSALVDLLSRGPGAVPSRVAGWWPDAGKAWIVPVDATALGAVADAAGRAAAARACRAAVGPTEPRA